MTINEVKDFVMSHKKEVAIAVIGVVAVGGLTCLGVEKFSAEMLRIKALKPLEQLKEFDMYLPEELGDMVDKAAGVYTLRKDGLTVGTIANAIEELPVNTRAKIDTEVVGVAIFTK